MSSTLTKLELAIKSFFIHFESLILFIKTSLYKKSENGGEAEREERKSDLKTQKRNNKGKKTRWLEGSIPKTDKMSFLFKFDAAEVLQWSFQDPASPHFDEIINFHNEVIYLTFIMLGVFWILFETLREYSKSNKMVFYKYHFLQKIHSLYILAMVASIFLSLTGFLLNAQIVLCDLEQDSVWTSLQDTPDRYHHYVRHYLNFPLTDSTHMPIGVKELVLYRLNSMSPEVLKSIFSSETEYEALEQFRYYAGSRPDAFDEDSQLYPARANLYFTGNFNQDIWDDIEDRFLSPNHHGSHSSAEYTDRNPLDSIGNPTPSEMAATGYTDFSPVTRSAASLPSLPWDPVQPTVSPWKFGGIPPLPSPVKDTSVVQDWHRASASTLQTTPGITPPITHTWSPVLYITRGPDIIHPPIDFCDTSVGPVDLSGSAGAVRHFPQDGRGFSNWKKLF